MAEKIDTSSFTYAKYPFLKELGIELENPGVFNGKWGGKGKVHYALNPSTNETIAAVHLGTVEELDQCFKAMDKVKNFWADLPLPKRGEVIRVMGVNLRKYKDTLGHLVSLEMGKILVEGCGEVQEAIDMCDYAVGLSRAMNTSVIPSERPDHFLMERYLPLKKHVGIITAFNFPIAVQFWNACNSLVCGNTQIWKGATSTSLCTIAATKIIEKTFVECGYPPEVCSMILGTGSVVGEALIKDPRIGLISFTGSTEIGTHLATVVAPRFCKTILELGGNNGLIVMEDADLKLALRAVLFAAVGTAGQRCTTLRRLFIHEKVYDEFVKSLLKAYQSVPIGDPLVKGTLCGPLHTKAAVKEYTDGIKTILSQGGKILFGGKERKDLAGPLANGNFVEPTLVEIDPNTAPIVKTELFVPILYIVKFKEFDEVIKMHNDVPQGLSSSMFTKNITNAFKWIGPLGSDCGIANVNIGPSGAEIGGAFGGEKETGGGRESGSDSWKQYCQRVTCTINYGKSLPLAQGIKFGDEDEGAVM